MLARIIVILLGFTILNVSGERSYDQYVEDKIGTLPRKEVLYIVGYQWGTPYTFNPLNGWPSWPVRPEFNLMYEPLLNYNSLTGETEPLLGKLWSADNSVVEVKLHKEARWSDGKALTAEDVIFTYNLHLRNSDSPCSYNVQGYIKEITSKRVDGVEIVSFYVDKNQQNNPLSILDHLAYIPILPKHIFEPKLKKAGGSIETLQDDLMIYPHVVSGPYNYWEHSSNMIVVKRRDDYWGDSVLYGGESAQPRYIAHPIYKDNLHSITALQHGVIDITSNYIPEVWQYRNKGVQTWFKEEPYHKKGAIPMFIINTTKSPLNNRKFRRAMALAINYGNLRKRSISSFSAPLQSGLIMPTGPESKYFDSTEVKAYGTVKYDPTGARELLQEMGYKSVFSGDSLLYMSDAMGRKVPSIKLCCPAGWTDFMSIIHEVVIDLRAAGIDARADYVDAATYFDTQYTGAFDLFLSTPAARLSHSMPWSRFNVIMSSKEWKPVGEKMYENTGRFNNPGSPEYNPKVDSLLALIPLLQDENELAKAYKRLNRIFMEEQPVIPLCYRPEEFYNFNDRHWINFPTIDNPYAPPHVPISGAARKILWRIKPAPERKDQWKFWK